MYRTGSIVVAILCAYFVTAQGRHASVLHSQLRRAIDGSNVYLCQDKAQCADVTDICTAGDPELAKALCPVSCGGCLCEDSTSTGINCTGLAPAICSGDFAYSLCAKTCKVCGPPMVEECKDHVLGITCAQLPNPCSDDLGKIACPDYCGFCRATQTTLQPTTAAPATTAPTTAAPTTAAPATTAPPATTPKATPAPYDPCTIQPCLNGGTCTVDGTTFKCTCPPGSTGFICHIAATNPPATTTSPPVTPGPATQPPSGPCSLQPCLNGGTCSVDGTSFKCACPDKFTGFACHIAIDFSQTTITAPPTLAPTTTPAPAPTSAPGSGTCSITTTKYNIGCIPAEIVFMIEYASSDQGESIDHEGDYIKELINEWRIDDNHIRVGVVVYHDTVTEAIHITDFVNYKRGLIDRISSITRDLKPSGRSDLAKALDFVREVAFKGARPNVDRIVMPIIHQMDDPEKNQIPAAAQRLKDTCAAILGVSVHGSSLDYDIISKAVSEPHGSYYHAYGSYTEMEGLTKWFYHPNCRK